LRVARIELRNNLSLTIYLTPNLNPLPTFAPSALQSMKILFSCEDFSEKSFACLIVLVVVLVLGKLSSPTYSVFGWWA
jgi:hypothetical protein